MATTEYFNTGGRTLRMPQQHQRMSSLHPNFKLAKLTPKLVSWNGVIHPMPLSETYAVSLVYEKYRAPRISVISPDLMLVAGAASLPHTYAGDHLCLYYPEYDEWTSAKYIAETIVPWISVWLVYYELWLATGEWLGGGITHQRKDKKQS
jgi:hypothetical protein